MNTHTHTHTQLENWTNRPESRGRLQWFARLASAKFSSSDYGKLVMGSVKEEDSKTINGELTTQIIFFLNSSGGGGRGRGKGNK